MLKKIIILALLYPTISMAQSISLNPLLSISRDNYCYQHKNKEIKSINSFFNINSKSNLKMMNQPVLSFMVQDTVINVNQTGENMKKQLLKYDSKKFPQDELEKTMVNNIYTLTLAADMEFAAKPVEVMNMLFKAFPGMKLNPDVFSGEYILSSGIATDFNKAKNIKDFNNQLENLPSSQIEFSINGSGNQSILNYHCKMVIVTNKTAQMIANELTQ